MDAAAERIRAYARRVLDDAAAVPAARARDDFHRVNRSIYRARAALDVLRDVFGVDDPQNAQTRAELTAVVYRLMEDAGVD